MQKGGRGSLNYSATVSGFLFFVFVSSLFFIIKISTCYKGYNFSTCATIYIPMNARLGTQKKKKKTGRRKDWVLS